MNKDKVDWLALTPDEGIVVSLCDKTGHMMLPWAEAGYRCLCIDTQHPSTDIENHPLHPNIKRWGLDILSDRVGFFMTHTSIAFVSAFPPCTDLTGSGSRWWKGKGDGAYEFAMKLVKRCEELAELTDAPYFIENPPGRIQSGKGCTDSPSPHRWRKWDYRFQPYEYGGWHGEGKDLWESHDIQAYWKDYEPHIIHRGEIPVWHRFTEFCRDKKSCTLPTLNNDGYHKSTCLWTGGGFVMPDRKPIPFNEFPNMIHHASPGPERANIRSVTPMGFAYATYEANSK
jgi:hypothetical protein